MISEAMIAPMTAYVIIADGRRRGLGHWLRNYGLGSNDTDVSSIDIEVDKAPTTLNFCVLLRRG